MDTHASGGTDGATEGDLRSVITCDMEGRIETFGADAEALFGYAADEVVGKARVSLFSPGLVVLEHVPKWLAAASKEGAYETDTVFRRRDGEPFAARIRITPTKRNGEQIGYCGRTVPLPEVAPAEAMPDISPWTRLFAALVVTRAPFLTATLAPMLVAAAAFAAGAGSVAWGWFALAAAAACALHVAANTFNDYYDHLSGADPANNDYFLALSGGSRAIELGLITPAGLRRLAWSALATAAALGGAIAVLRAPEVLAVGAVGAFSAIFYTAPPLRLVARKGLGELFVGLNFGPLLVLGTLAALAGGLDGALVRQGVLLGLPVGLWTAAILWINEFPDAPSDAATGKLNLVAALGPRRARAGYAALVAAAYGTLGLAVVLGAAPAGTLLALATLPVAAWAVAVAYRHYNDRSLVRVNKATIGLQLVFALLMAAGFLV